MSMTGLDVFDRTVHKTNSWLNELMEILGWSDRHKAYLALRVTLHALRDRLHDARRRSGAAGAAARPHSRGRADRVARDLRAVEEEVEEVICAVTPEPFYAVGLWYEDFSQTTDEEVRELLARAEREYEGRRSHATHGRSHTD